MEEAIPKGPLVERGLDSSECEKTEGLEYPRQRGWLVHSNDPTVFKENGLSVCPAPHPVQARLCRMSVRQRLQRCGIIRAPWGMYFSRRMVVPIGAS